MENTQEIKSHIIQKLEILEGYCSMMDNSLMEAELKKLKDLLTNCKIEKL